LLEEINKNYDNFMTKWMVLGPRGRLKYAQKRTSLYTKFMRGVSGTWNSNFD